MAVTTAIDSKAFIVMAITSPIASAWRRASGVAPKGTTALYSASVCLWI